MGGGKGGGNEAAQARADEQARQDRIRQGTTRINDIFNGALSGTGQLKAGAAYDPTKTYYNADGSVWKPATAGATTTTQTPGQSYFDGHSWQTGPAGTQTTVQRAADPASQFAAALAGGKLYSGTQRTGGFDDKFFDSRRQAYMDYANPQLADQYAEAQRQLTFALARGGNLDSSTRGQQAGVLQKEYDLNKQKIADDALASETTARNAVEDARANLIATLNATGDAEGAANSALARSAALSQPAAYSPLSQLFADFTAGLGVQAAQARADYYGGGGNSPSGVYSFNNANGSVKNR